MRQIDPERRRLEQAEQETHSRFLRLQGVADPVVVRAAQELWQEAAEVLRNYERTRP